MRSLLNSWYQRFRSKILDNGIDLTSRTTNRTQCERVLKLCIESKVIHVRVGPYDITAG